MSPAIIPPEEPELGDIEAPVLRNKLLSVPSHIVEKALLLYALPPGCAP